MKNIVFVKCHIPKNTSLKKENKNEKERFDSLPSAIFNGSLVEEGEGSLGVSSYEFLHIDRSSPTKLTERGTG